jgi:hypothetical protein
MAISYSHKFGQIIGELLEVAIEPFLKEFANKHNLYLDRKGERKTRKGVKLTWIDIKENKHDLDFVLEEGGSDINLGTPVGFIETAWRRYTKHSRNKAQEIQGAIIPLLEKFNYSSPFAAVILAGEFTQGSLIQLQSQGFIVLYFPYSTVIEAFRRQGIDAAFEEDTSEEDFKLKVDAYLALNNKFAIAEELIKINAASVKEFLQSLEVAITRKVSSIIISPLHGQSFTVPNVDQAIEFINGYLEEETRTYPFCKYEIIVKYNTGTIINASCTNKQDAIMFLKNHINK